MYVSGVAREASPTAQIATSLQGRRLRLDGRFAFQPIPVDLLEGLVQFFMAQFSKIVTLGGIELKCSRCFHKTR